MNSAASSDDVTLGDIEEQEMWEEHTRERVKQMQEASSAARGHERVLAVGNETFNAEGGRAGTSSAARSENGEDDGNMGMDRVVPGGGTGGCGDSGDSASQASVAACSGASSYRIEADQAISEYDALELDAGIMAEALVKIEQGRPNMAFDPWAQEVARKALLEVSSRVTDMLAEMLAEEAS